MLKTHGFRFRPLTKLTNGKFSAGTDPDRSRSRDEAPRLCEEATRCRMMGTRFWTSEALGGMILHDKSHYNAIKIIKNTHSPSRLLL